MKTIYLMVNTCLNGQVNIFWRWNELMLGKDIIILIPNSSPILNIVWSIPIFLLYFIFDNNFPIWINIQWFNFIGLMMKISLCCFLDFRVYCMLELSFACIFVSIDTGVVERFGETSFTILRLLLSWPPFRRKIWILKQSEDLKMVNEILKSQFQQKVTAFTYP